MFTRTVEVTPKSGKARELANTINEKVLPILKKQAGFVDETLLVSLRIANHAAMLRVPCMPFISPHRIRLQREKVPTKALRLP
jgi:hypothetical protein